jgi:hypothetical protein
MRLDGILLANSSPPNRFAVGQIRHRGPIGKVASEYDAGVTLPIEKFRATLHPILGIEPNHEPGLIIERSVLAVDARLEGEITVCGQMEEMAVIGDVTVESFAPEIGFRATANNELIARSLRGGRLVEPSHAANKIVVRMKKRREDGGKSRSGNHCATRDNAGLLEKGTPV